MQRYLTGTSIGQSRLGLLLNAMAKVPVQLFILFIGAMVFVFFVFERPPLLFQPVELKRLEQTVEFRGLEGRYQKALDEREAAARKVKDGGSGEEFRAAQQKVNAVRDEGGKLSSDSDTNYIFLYRSSRVICRGLAGADSGSDFHGGEDVG